MDNRFSLILLQILIGAFNLNANNTLSDKEISELPAFPTISEKCNTVCIEIYDPVCGQNNDELRVFPNECHLMVANCKSNQQYVKVRLSKCEQPICPNLKQPICARSGQQFHRFKNRCSLNLHNCRFRQKFRPVMDLALCNNVTNEVCPTFCPAVYDPICAKSGDRFMRFGNSCELAVHNCRYQENFKIVKKGECEDVVGTA